MAAAPPFSAPQMPPGAPGYPGPGPGASIPSSLVELSISCRGLVDMDVFSKSDPMCVLFIREFGSQNWRELGRTETIMNTVNPDFVKKFQVDYFFEERQLLQFSLYDIDSKSARLEDHDFLGSMECTLGEIVTTGVLKKPLRGPKANSGCIVVRSEELTACKQEVTVKWEARALDKKDFFGKSDPFLEFRKVNEDGSFVVTHRTEVIKNTLNPVWRQFALSSRTLCNGDSDRAIKVLCYDWNKSGSHDLIGGFVTTLRQLSEGVNSPQNTYQCIHDEKRKRKGSKYKNSGIVSLSYFNLVDVPSFLDFIKGGTQIHCTVAIDFTASNGDPRHPQSLHYMDPYRPNQYATALRSVMEVIQDYDTARQFPALGFGAKVPPHGKVSHEFFLNGDPSNPYCPGLEGVMDAYHKALYSVTLYGPTNFAPIINHVARFAHAYQDGNHYFILVMLTDGIITDMPQAKQAIVSAARLPLSIIIIGVGGAEFDSMDELDGDDVRVSYNGVYAERDIVQFVPFREFIGSGQDFMMSKARLAKEVLAEIPDQLVGYMRKRGFTPRPPPPPDAQFAFNAAAAGPGAPPPSQGHGSPPYPHQSGAPPHPQQHPGGHTQSTAPPPPYSSLS